MAKESVALYFTTYSLKKTVFHKVVLFEPSRIYLRHPILNLSVYVRNSEKSVSRYPPRLYRVTYTRIQPIVMEFDSLYG